MLLLLRDNKNILFIVSDLKETSGAHLTQIPPAGLQPHPFCSALVGRENRWKSSSDLWAPGSADWEPDPRAGGSHAVPDSLRISSSPRGCWYFVVHKLHGQQVLWDSNAYLPAGGVNPPELCRLWTKLNAKGRKLTFIILWGYGGDTQWS